MSGPIRKAVAANLRTLKATSTADGQLALALAGRLDDPSTADSAVGPMARVLDEILQRLNATGKPKEVSPLDEIRSRREKRVRRAEA